MSPVNASTARLFQAALILAQLMLAHQPPLVRASLSEGSVQALAAYLVRTVPDYCRAVEL